MSTMEEQMEERIVDHKHQLIGLNRQIMSGADEVWIINSKGRWMNLEKFKHNVNLRVHTLLRTIQYKKPTQILYVMEMEHKTDLELVRSTMKTFTDKFETFAEAEKFSGNESIHAITKVTECPQLYDVMGQYPDIYSWMKSTQIGMLEACGCVIAERVDIRKEIDNPRLICVKPGTRKKIRALFGREMLLADSKLFEKRRRFRTFTVHQGSGRFAVPIEPDDTVDDMLQKSQLLLPFSDKFDIPIFDHYGFDEPNGFIHSTFMPFKFQDINIPDELKVSYERLTRLIPYPCIVADLLNHKFADEPTEGATHFARYFLVAWLRHLRLDQQGCYGFIKSLDFPDFDMKKTGEQISYGFKDFNDYYLMFARQPLFIICRQIMNEGLCLGECCECHDEVVGKVMGDGNGNNGYNEGGS